MKILKTILIFFFLLIILCLFYFGLVYTAKNISNDLARTILDYIKILVWPLVVAVIALSFKNEISGLINRIVSGEMSGFKFIATPQQEKKAESDLESKLRNIPNENKNKLEEMIQEKEDALTTATINIGQLQKELVRKEIELDFERIFNIIFASQIDLLSKMAVFGYLGMQSIIQHFTLIKRAFEPIFNNWDLPMYLRFLFDQKLIEQKDNYTICITIKGKAFLQYLSIMNYQKYGN